MRYAADQKEQTRKLIVAKAANSLRLHGADGIGIAGIMEDAGLTHGGFYAHFASKDALIAEACRAALQETSARLDAEMTDMPRYTALATFIEWYVSARHRDRMDRGCVFTTLATDLARRGPETRTVIDEAHARLVTRLAALLTKGPVGQRRVLAEGLLAEMVGAVILARAMADRGASDTLLGSARRRLLRRAGVSATEH